MSRINPELRIFHLGQTGAEYVNEQYLDGPGGLREAFDRLRLVDVTGETPVEAALDILIVENDLPDIMRLLPAICSRDLELSIGICYSPLLFERLLSSLASSPKVVTLDFDLADKSETDPRKRFKPTETLMHRVQGLREWHKTVILGISNWAREELSQQLVELVRTRGDSVFQKQQALWTLLPDILEDALHRHELRQRLDNLDALEIPRINQFHGMVGSSNIMRQIYQTIRRAGPTDSSVLITGETGTGKELAAKALVFESQRKEKPFIKVNCAALPETLAESELFGHVKGAFTGSVGAKKGKFASADEGTILLDEIGELPLPVQATLLRVLEDGTFDPVGSIEPSKVDVRVIAATNRDLSISNSRGKFRQDLYHRLRTIPLKLPPLRYRKNDIPQLVIHFMNEIAGQEKSVDQTAMEKLKSYSWPGNVRDLKNCIERAIVLSEGQTIEAADIILEQDHPAKVLHGGSGKVARWTFEQCIGSKTIVRNRRDQLARLLKLLFDAYYDGEGPRTVTDEELLTIPINVSTDEGKTRLSSKINTLRERFENNPDSGWRIPLGEYCIEPRT